MFWEDKLKHIEPLRDIQNLPNFGFQFFFKHMGRFKKAFFVFTAARMTSITLGFRAFHKY